MTDLDHLAKCAEAATPTVIAHGQAACGYCGGTGLVYPKCPCCGLEGRPISEGPITLTVSYGQERIALATLIARVRLADRLAEALRKIHKMYYCWSCEMCKHNDALLAEYDALTKPEQPR